MSDPVPGQSALESSTISTPVIDGGTPMPSPSTDGGWFETLPEGLRKEGSLQAFKDKPISAVVESYINAQKSFGSRLPVPLPTDKPEDRAAKVAAIQAALGKPAAPKDYKVVDPAYETMGLKKNEQSLNSFLEVSHRAGLTNEQVQALVDWQAQDALKSAPDHAADAEKCIEALRDGSEGQPGWGSTLPHYIAIAKRAADSMFPESVRQSLENQGFYNNPDFIRGMYQIGRSLIEDNILVGDEVNTTGTGQTAQKELDSLMADPEGPYYDRDHADHEKAVARALDLRRLLQL